MNVKEDTATAAGSSNTEDDEHNHPSSDINTNETAQYSLPFTMPNLYHVPDLSLLESDIKLENTTDNKPSDSSEYSENSGSSDPKVDERNIPDVTDTVKDPKPFKCSKCSYAAALKSTLKRHLRTHISKCPHCSYVAASNYDLQIHIRKHTREKPFKCPQCEFATASKSSLQRHIKTHTGERPFKCPDCPYTAARKGCLNVHVMKHVVRNPFKCPHCSFGAVEVSSLNHHVKTHIGE